MSEFKVGDEVMITGSVYFGEKGRVRDVVWFGSGQLKCIVRGLAIYGLFPADQIALVEDEPTSPEFKVGEEMK